MPLDPSIPLQVKSADPTNLISGFLDLGLKKNQLDVSRETIGARIRQADAESRRAVTEADVASQTAAPRVSSAQSQAGTAATQLNTEQLANARAHAAAAAQQIQALLTKPDLNRGDIAQNIAASLTQFNAPAAAYAAAFQGLPPPDAKPEELRNFLLQSLNRAQSVSAQLDKVAPNPQLVSTGQQAVPVIATNPALSGQPTPSVQMQVPPTAVTMGPNGQPTYVGPRPQQQAPIPSGPAIGQPEGIIGPTNVATEHYKGVVADAQPAQTRIASLQTIKAEAPKAITGGGDWRRKILSQLSGVFGLANDEQTANDVMAKNLSVLAQQAGNTDAARALAEMANPNSHMTKDAIEETANQLIGIEGKKVSAQQFFAGIPTNDPRYQERIGQWSKYADPRLWEYANLQPEQKAAWMKKLSPGVRAQLGMKAQALEKLGVDFGQ